MPVSASTHKFSSFKIYLVKSFSSDRTILVPKHFWHAHFKEKRATLSLWTFNGFFFFLLCSMINSTLNPGLTDDSVYARETFH